MSCKKVQALLPLLAGGELDGREREDALSHVARCAACRERLSQLEALRDLLASAPDPGFTESERLALRRNVLRAIRVEGRSASPGFSRPLRELFGGLFHPVLATVAALLIVLLVSLHRRTTVVNPEIGPLARVRSTPVPQDVAPPAEAQSASLPPRPAPTQVQAPEAPALRPPREAVAARRRRATSPESVPFGSLPSAGGPSRIEIQTSDPSVRIIWLSPGSADSAENESTSS